MAGGKGGKGGDTTQTSIPKWLQQYGHRFAHSAEQAAKQPFKEYGGNLTANIDPLTQQAIDYTGEQMGKASSAMDPFLQQMQLEMGYKPEQITARQFSDVDMSKYMNPYQQGVIDPAMKEYERQRQQVQNQGAAQAQAAGAFGGSRHGLAQAETNRGFADVESKFLGNLMQQGYESASGRAMQDIQNDLAAQQYNVGAGLQGQQARLAAAGAGLQGVGAQQQTGLQSALAAQQGGQLRQQQRQRELDARYQQFLRKQQYPDVQLSRWQSAIGVPHNVTQTGPSSNPWLTGLGGLFSGIGGIAGLM